jgi:hypothetical protein
MCDAKVDHEAIKLDDASWSALVYVGIQPDVDDSGRDASLELRNCTCGSTLCRPVQKRSTR